MCRKPAARDEDDKLHFVARNMATLLHALHQGFILLAGLSQLFQVLTAQFRC